jgi:hypothetical protein
MKATIVVIWCVFLTGCLTHSVLHSNSTLQPYAGQWMLKSAGKKMMVLKTEVHHGRIIGSLTMPKHHTEDWNGDFIDIRIPIITLPVTGKRKGHAAELVVGSKPDQDYMLARLTDLNHLSIARYHGIVPNWKFERATPDEQVVVDSDWPTYNDDPEIESIRQRLRAMAAADRSAREAETIDESQTRKLSEEDRSFLRSIFMCNGWPKISKFGVQACDDFWLLVQHQPLALQEEMLPAMQRAVESGEASKRDYAYLFDRVQVEKGRPQFWGTQSKCEHGRAVLANAADMMHIEERRQDVGLGSLAESLKAADSICKRLPN